MSESEIPRVAITHLASGVPGLDEVLGGGLPEYSFNLIAGAPGSGKTTLAHQILFSLASPQRRALYFSVVGEPPLKMLRYQQQMAYFDPAKVGESIRFINLSDAVLTQDLNQVLQDIVRQVEESNPGLIVLDSFHNIVRAARGQAPGDMDVHDFVQRLTLYLTSWQTTTFLLGSYRDDELRVNPVFTMADGILWLSQVADHNTVVRKLQVIKVRGQEPMPGLHTMRLDQAGLQVFPRITIGGQGADQARPLERVTTGVPGLDELIGGGLPAGDAVMVTGPSGTGKSILAAQYIAAGVRHGEPGVIAIFEERPQEYIQRAEHLGLGLQEMVRQGALAVIYVRPLDLSPDETLLEIREAVARIGARRVAIDSVSGFELALAPDFREDFRESLYRLVGALTGSGITVLMTMEVTQSIDTLRLSPYLISFLADDIIVLRHVEIAGQFRKSLAVLKMRNSDHSKELWLFDITARGLMVRQSLRDSWGTGMATAELGALAAEQAYPGLIDVERLVLRALADLRNAPAEALARRTGLQEAGLAAALDRLIALRYVEREGQAAAAVYRLAQ